MVVVKQKDGQVTCETGECGSGETGGWKGDM